MVTAFFETVNCYTLHFLNPNSDMNPNDVTHGLKATDSFTVSASYALGSATNGPK